MPLSSKAPAAKVYLLAALKAAPALAAVRVDGYPMTDANQTAENLYFDNTEFTQSFRGINSRNDDFTFNLACRVRRSGNSGDLVEARVWEIVTAVQLLIDADPHLGGILNVAAEVSGGVVSPYPATPSDWEARADVRVRCQAVLCE